MRKLVCLLFLGCMALSAHASDATKETPIKHRDVPEVTSMQQAKAVFIETTLALKGKQKLDAAALHQIHVITYDLEQSVAYFKNNLKGEAHGLMSTMADVVERIHLNSENNRVEATQEALNAYFDLVKTFIEQHWRVVAEA